MRETQAEIFQDVLARGWLRMMKQECGAGVGSGGVEGGVAGGGGGGEGMRVGVGGGGGGGGGGAEGGEDVPVGRAAKAQSRVEALVRAENTDPLHSSTSDEIEDELEREREQLENLVRIATGNFTHAPPLPAAPLAQESESSEFTANTLEDANNALLDRIEAMQNNFSEFYDDEARQIEVTGNEEQHSVTLIWLHDEGEEAAKSAPAPDVPTTPDTGDPADAWFHQLAEELNDNA